MPKRMPIRPRRRAPPTPARSRLKARLRAKKSMRRPKKWVISRRRRPEIRQLKMRRMQPRRPPRTPRIPLIAQPKPHRQSRLQRMELRPRPRPTKLLSPLLKAQLKPSPRRERITLRQRKRPPKSPLLLRLHLLPPAAADAHSERK